MSIEHLTNLRYNIHNRYVRGLDNDNDFLSGILYGSVTILTIMLTSLAPVIYENSPCLCWFIGINIGIIYVNIYVSHLEHNTFKRTILDCIKDEIALVHEQEDYDEDVEKQQ